MIEIATYLASPQAREDVRALLADLPARRRSNGTFKPEGESGSRLDDRTLLSARKAQAWTRIGIAQRWTSDLGWDHLATVYCRPNADGRLVVSELGDGVQSLRLRTGCIKMNPSRIVEAIYAADAQDYGACVVAMQTDSAALPDVICRVMLGSWKVANLSPASDGQERTGE